MRVRSKRAAKTQRPTRWPPGVPRYAVRTVRPRLVRVPRTYSTWGPGGKPPCASGTYPTREAGTRSPYVPNGGPGAYVSARLAADGGEGADVAQPHHAVVAAGEQHVAWFGLGLGLGLG